MYKNPLSKREVNLLILGLLPAAAVDRAQRLIKEIEGSGSEARSKGHEAEPKNAVARAQVAGGRSEVAARRIGAMASSGGLCDVAFNSQLHTVMLFGMFRRAC